MTRLAYDQRGATLLSAVMLMSIFGALVAAYAMNVRASLSLRGGTAQERVGFYSAEAGLNVGITRFVNIFRQNGVPEQDDFTQEFALDDRTVDVTLSKVTGCDPCTPTQIPAGEQFAGLNTIPYRYLVESRSLSPSSDYESHVAGEFDIHTIPIFQFLAFINGNLYLMPLPDATFHGRLHTNANLYIQPDNDLRVEDNPPTIPNVQVSSVGNTYRGGRKYDDSWRCWGNAYVDKLEDVLAPMGNLDPKELLCTGDTNPLPDSTLASWLGTMEDDVSNIITPDVGIINRGDGEYWQNAELRVVLRRDLPGAAIDFSAADLCPGGPGTLVSPALSVIEVQDADGSQNAGKTRALWRFMCERRGAIFYNEIPEVGPTPPNGNNGNVFDNPNGYTPDFAAANRVYRRAGEDSNGDGLINLSDRNDDICPIGAGDAPWWRPASCPWPNGAAIGTSWFTDMDYRRGGFFNHREQQWMTLLNVNMRALIEWNQVNNDVLFNHGDTTEGGLVIFLSVQGPDSNAAVNNYGARIFDSADLDTRNVTFPPGVSNPTGLTVVSDQFVILEGNYNKVDKYPAAIMADSISVLSQGWEVPVAGNPNDLKSVFDLDTDVRDVPATDLPGGTPFTTSTALGVNTAFLFGLGPSTLDPEWYNGGLENFPRFLESWNNRTLNYRGSFVSLGEAQHKLANWACGSGNACNGSGVYDPPTRAYDYDADFSTVENLPPLTPKIVYVQQRLYTRMFD